MGHEHEQKAALIQAALQTGNGREKLAQAMAAPLRRLFDRQAAGRRIFQVEELPPHSEPVFMDIDGIPKEPLFGPEDMFPRGHTERESG